jgi:hypothetical protein
MPPSAPDRAAILASIANKVSAKSSTNSSTYSTQTAQKQSKLNAGAKRLHR